MRVLLDTHIWLWWLTPDSPLTRSERDALDALADRRDLVVSAVSLWEAQMLHSKGRFALGMAFPDWIEQAASGDIVSIAPLDVAVVVALDGLPRAFHGDPADRVIVATARSRDLPVATRDRRIRRSRVVSLWRP